MHDDPLRAQSVAFVVGGVLGTIAVVASAVLALVRPQGVPASAPIVIARDSGALYVRIGDSLHPVPNLASARLVARSAANPVTAESDSIDRATRGPRVGIPGAPARIGRPVDARTWTVCDDERTVVIGGDAPVGRAAPVLVTPRGESAATTYLLYDGHRAKVDLRNAAAVRALRLDGVVPVGVSRVLLDVVPEVAAIEAPRIAGAGGPGPATLDARIGTVVRVLRADGPEFYVVLADGVQPVAEVVADLVGFTYGREAGPMPTVAPAVLASTPVVASLPVAAFPAHAGTPVGAGDDVAVCATWGSGTSNVTVLKADPSRIGGVPLVQADGEGPNVDAVLLPAGRSAWVRSAPTVGDDGVSGTRFLVDDTGVVFGVRDGDAARYLGLDDEPVAAPWPILAQLPRGPELSVEAASVVRDGFAAP